MGTVILGASAAILQKN